MSFVILLLSGSFMKVENMVLKIIRSGSFKEFFKQNPENKKNILNIPYNILL